MKKYFKANETILSGANRDRESVYCYGDKLYKIAWGHGMCVHTKDGKTLHNTEIPGVIEAESEEEAVLKLLGEGAELVKVPEHTPESWLPPDERK